MNLGVLELNDGLLDNLSYPSLKSYNLFDNSINTKIFIYILYMKFYYRKQ